MQILFVLLLVFLNIRAANPVLRQLIVVSRHGIRAHQMRLPKITCPLNQLNARITHLGHRQNFALGALIREKYGDAPVFRNAQGTFAYDWSRHIFYATDADKNLMSGNTVAQGLFTNYFSQVTIAGQPLVPSIPVRFIPDHVLNADSSASSCQALITKIQQQIMQNNTDFQALNKQYKSCYEKIQAASGVSKDDFNLTLDTAPRFAEQNILNKGHLNYLDNRAIFDEGATINGFDASKFKQCLYDYNDNVTEHTCPEEAGGKSFTETVIYLATRRQQFLSDRRYRDMAKLRTTPFIDFVYHRMKDYIVNHTDVRPNSTWYSFVFMLGENGNVQNLMQLFNQFTPGRVPFGSSVAFELYYTGSTDSDETNEAKYQIQVKYRRMSNDSFAIQNVKYDAEGHESNTDDEYIDWTKEICNKEYCAPSDLLNMVYTMDEWHSKCISEENPDAQYYQDELKQTEAALSETEDDKKFYQNMFVIFLVILLVLLVACIVIIILMCCGCINTSSGGENKEETVADEPADSA